MNVLAQKDKCTGCGACKNICHQNAIEFKTDETGFPYPIINEDKCLDCGICAKNCPVNTPVEGNIPLQVYGLQIKDRDVLRKSTSGGVFWGLAEAVINRRGVVYGCVWDN